MALNSLPTPDEALAGMAKVGAPREPMGNSAYSASYPSADTGRAIQQPRKNTQAGDPAAQPMGTRAPVVISGINGGSERLGAKHTITAVYSEELPEAHATQANGRIVSPSVVRSRQSFDQGAGTSY